MLHAVSGVDGPTREIGEPRSSSSSERTTDASESLVRLLEGGTPAAITGRDPTVTAPPLAESHYRMHSEWLRAVTP